MALGSLGAHIPVGGRFCQANSNSETRDMVGSESAAGNQVIRSAGSSRNWAKEKWPYPHTHECLERSHGFHSKCSRGPGLSAF
jgi:hypothetical protein